MTSRPRVRSWIPRLHDVGATATLGPLLDQAARDPLPEDFFDFLRVLGTGNYGKVHLARYGKTGEKLAVKVQLAVQWRRAMVELKVMLIASGNSPFLVNLHSHFRTSIASYIVMEYVPGGSLTQKLKEPFSTAAAAFYSAQIALALIHLHDLGVLYRDLKPDNVLLTEDNNLKLCDFGSCYLHFFTRKQVKKLRRLPYGRPADWWSLGIILYQMLTAELPFVAAKPGFDHYRNAVLSSRPRFGRSLSSDAVSACQSFLEMDPDKRLGGPQEQHCVLDHPLYRRLVNWEALQEAAVRPPPMYAHRSASMPAYVAY